MNYKLFLTGLLFACSQAYGQGFGTEKISVRTTQPIQFVYGNVDELLKAKEIPNAIEVNLKVKSNNYNVFANIRTNTPQQTEILENKLALRLLNHNSANANTVHEVLLSQSPKLLLTQPAQNNNTQHFNFYYSLILYPFTNFVEAGSYDYSIAFTMTKP